jgi:hypothetical protein
MFDCEMDADKVYNAAGLDLPGDLTSLLLAVRLKV